MSATWSFPRPRLARYANFSWSLSLAWPRAHPLSLHVYRRNRSAWWRHELYNDGHIRWINVSWAHPRRHAWWAVSVYLYY